MLIKLQMYQNCQPYFFFLGGGGGVIISDILMSLKPILSSPPLQKCCICFAHIVGNILHTICTYVTYYLMTICICAKYENLTKIWAYAQYQIHSILSYPGTLGPEGSRKWEMSVNKKMYRKHNNMSWPRL